MADQFQVQADAIDRFATGSLTRGDEFEEVIRALEGAEVGHEGFGKMPASSDLYSSYAEHTRACLEDLKACGDAMKSIADRAKATAAGYREGDAATAEGMTQIANRLDGIAVPRAGR